jgi:hypothetical protein
LIAALRVVFFRVLLQTTDECEHLVNLDMLNGDILNLGVQQPGAMFTNLSSQGRVDVEAIFANPIYARLIGSFEQINQRFDGKLKEIVGEMQMAFKAAA